MSQPFKVSMVMPTKDRARYVPIAVRCFLQQTFESRELIIVDDGTEPLVLPNDPRIHHIRLSVSTPTGTKRNLGAERATGNIIANLDDDDWSHPYRLADQVQRLVKTGKAVTGYNASIIYDERGGLFYKIPGGPPYFASGSSQCYMRSWWERHPYPNVSFGEDSVFSRTARLADELAISEPGKMLVVRQHGANTAPVYLPKLPKLTEQDISTEFLKVLDNSATLEYDDVGCRADAERQFQVPVVEYKINHLPKIVTR